MHSVVSAGHLLRTGVTQKVVRERIKDDGWAPLWRGWYWTGPSPTPPQARGVAYVATRNDGGPDVPTPKRGTFLPRPPRPTDVVDQPPLVLGGRLAAELLGLELPPKELPDLLVSPEAGGARRSGTVRQRRTLAPEEITYCGQGTVLELRTDAGLRPVPWLPVTAPARFLQDCIPFLADLQLLWMVEQVLKRHPCDVLAGASRRQRARLAPLVAVADPRSRSPLETGVRRLLLEGGCPPPEVNVTVLEGVVCDLVWRDKKLVVECDGYAWHSEPSVISKDAERHRALQRAGWTVMRVTYAELMNSPGQVLADVLTFLAA